MWITSFSQLTVRRGYFLYKTPIPGVRLVLLTTLTNPITLLLWLDGLDALMLAMSTTSLTGPWAGYLFDKPGDYAAFENILTEAWERSAMRLLNHWPRNIAIGFFFGEIVATVPPRG